MPGPGGARPGAGRKKKSEKYATPIAQAEQQIVDRLPFLIDKLMELSDGVWVEKPIGGAEVRVYKQAPDFKALSYLVDRVMGKPVQTQQITGDEGSSLTIKVEYAEPETDVEPEESDNTDPA